MVSSGRVHDRGGHHEPGGGPAGARSALEPVVAEVVALWAEHLDVSEIGPEDDFFALGGNSLIGIRIIDRLAGDHGVALSVRAFYLARTPAGVAELVAAGRAGS